MVIIVVVTLYGIMCALFSISTITFDNSYKPSEYDTRHKATDAISSHKGRYLSDMEAKKIKHQIKTFRDKQALRGAE